MEKQNRVGCFPTKTPSKPNPNKKRIEKSKYPLDGVVRHNTLVLFILFSLFTIHASLLARDALPVLVEAGEPFKNRDKFYIDKPSFVTSVVISQDGERIFSGSNDGTFLYKKDGVKLKLIEPKWLTNKDSVSLKSSGVSVVNDSHNSLKIAVDNTSNERLYWVKNSYYTDEYCHLLEHRASNINAHEVKNLFIDVDVTLPRLNPKPIDNHEINLTLVTATGSEFNITVPVSIRYANMVVKKAEVSEDGKKLNIQVKNIGNETLLKSDVNLSKPYSRVLK